MNARKLILVLGASSIFWVSASTLAQQKADNQELIARLERMASDSDSKARMLTGGPKQQWLLRELRIKNLIEKLKAGQQVDPREIDEILKQQSR